MLVGESSLISFSLVLSSRFNREGASNWSPVSFSPIMWLRSLRGEGPMPSMSSINTVNKIKLLLKNIQFNVRKHIWIIISNSLALFHHQLAWHSVVDSCDVFLSSCLIPAIDSPEVNDR